MNTEESFEKYVDEIEQAELRDVGFNLMLIERWPTGDPRMLAYLDGYLEDTRPTMITFAPEYYAEVRYAAGRALAAERGVQGIKEGVLVPASVIPLKSGDMVNIAQKAQLDFIYDPLKLLTLLMEKELAPRRHHGFSPRIPPNWLNKVDKPD